jgi:hypothetical protein
MSVTDQSTVPPPRPTLISQSQGPNHIWSQLPEKQREELGKIIGQMLSRRYSCDRLVNVLGTHAPANGAAAALTFVDAAVTSMCCHADSEDRLRSARDLPG